MVESKSDPDVVTARIIRETREADARALQKAAEAKLNKVEYLEARPARQETTAALVVSEESPVEAKEAAETSYRHGRIIVVAVFVVVIFLVWLQERRSR